MEEDADKKLTWNEFWKILGPSFKGTGWLYFFSILLILIAAIATAAEPVIYGRIIDRVIDTEAGIGHILRDLLPWLVGWAGASVLAALAKHASQILSWKSGYKVNRDFVFRSLKNVLAWDTERFGRTSLGATSKRFDRAWEAAWTLSSRMLTDILPSTIVFIVFVTVGFWLDWRMALVTLSAIPVLATLTLVAYRFADKKQRELNQAWEDVSRNFTETLQSILPIKAFASEDRMLLKTVKQIEFVTKRQEELNFIWTGLDVSNNTITLAARLAVVTTGLILIGKGDLSVGTLVTFLGMITNILAPFDYLLADVVRRISEIRASFGQLHDDWTKSNLIVDGAKPKRLRSVRGELAFEHIYVRYHGSSKDVLKDVSLRVRAGTSLALVGPSGSGKSTFVRLINRFIDPAAGKILLDGTDIRDCKLEDLRKSVGLVQQETVLFNDTIYNNVLFACPNAKRSEVLAACKRAQAHDFIKRLPDGYETLIGERGAKLSGGERQRIALARVFLADPPILVLDESTSALDSETEHKLQLALQAVMQDRTTIIIAHRLSTVYLADQIAVIDKGELAELGNHTDLIREGGMYERLWKLQSGGYLPD
jgi:ATP-binding cassette, subfamily B, bacterial